MKSSNDKKKSSMEVLKTIEDRENLEKAKNNDSIQQEEIFSRKKNKDNRNRPIYAAILDWRDSETIKEFFQSNKKPKDIRNIFCEQKFGARTTWRRNKALEKRKELKEKNSIIAGYVQFPAKLMVKKPGQNKYVLAEDFSKIDVIFN